MATDTGLRILFTLFIVVPIIEMWVLIQVGSVLGALPTIAMVVATAAIGVALLKRQGYSALRRAKERSRRGELPTEELIEGVFFAVGGALLLTPGFVTDGLGFCCLIPKLRQRLIAIGLRQWAPRVYPAGRPRTGTTIDGSFQRDDDRANPVDERREDKDPSE